MLWKSSNPLNANHVPTAANFLSVGLRSSLLQRWHPDRVRTEVGIQPSKYHPTSGFTEYTWDLPCISLYIFAAQLLAKPTTSNIRPPQANPWWNYVACIHVKTLGWQFQRISYRIGLPSLCESSFWSVISSHDHMGKIGFWRLVWHHLPSWKRMDSVSCLTRPFNQPAKSGKRGTQIFWLIAGCWPQIWGCPEMVVPLNRSFYIRIFPTKNHPAIPDFRKLPIQWIQNSPATVSRLHGLQVRLQSCLTQFLQQPLLSGAGWIITVVNRGGVFVE